MYSFLPKSKRNLVNGQLTTLWRVMKLIAICMTMLFVQLSAATLAQNLTLKRKKASLREVFDEISKQTGFFVLAGTTLLDQAEPVTIELKNMPLHKALEKILENQQLEFTIEGKDIIIKREESLPSAKEKPPTFLKQEIKINGKVVDQSNKPIPGVSVRIKGAQRNGTTTNNEGVYQLTIPHQGVLIFTAIGYQPKEVATDGNTALVVLQDSQEGLDEVVVVGYGTQKKINLTGSVATVDGAELAKSPTNNLTNAIGGRMPGVSAVNGNGRPGSGSTIKIRGLSTLNDNSPLVVVDGIIRTDGFGNIDPNEVDNISILKDASAAAVYGARAANGVILVTTKRGKLGKPSMNYTGMVGMQEPTQYPRLMSAYEYALTRNQAFLNQGYDPSNPAQENYFYDDDDLERFKTDGTDWYKESFKKQSLQTQHNLSIAGGTEAIRYFGSLGYLDQDGLYDNIGFKRYNLRSNIDANISKSLTVGLNLEARQEVSDAPSWDANDIFHRVINVSPVRKAYYPSGRPANTTGSHPVEMIRSSGYDNKEYNIFQGTLFFEQKLAALTEGLSLRGNFSYFKQHMFNKKFALPYTMYDEDEAGNIISEKMVGSKTSLFEVFEELNNATVNLSLNYDHDFNKHHVSGLLLYEQFSAKGKTFNARKEDFSTDIKDEFFASGPTNQTIDGNGILNDARRSVVGRFNYAYDSKYLLEGTFRYDGSYRFPKNSRYGFFPAFSAGWRISEEGFFKQASALDFINSLKLRVSKGLIGNDRVDAYQYQESYALVSGAGPIVDGQALPYVAYGVFPNKAITWEKQDNTNIGLDVELFKSAFGLEIDYFFRKTRDILWTRDRSVPETFGRVLPDENYAKVNSKGIELTLTHQKSFTDFSYNLRLVGSYAVNEVTQIDDPANALDFDRQLGRPIGFRAGYESLGLFQSQQQADSWYGGYQFGQKSLAGDIQYQDIDGDGQITIQDQKVISSYGSDPRMMYGLSGNLNWKNFDLNFFFQGATQRNIMLTGSGRVMYLNGGSSNNFAYLTDSWTADNPDAQYPLAWIDSRLVNNRDAQFWLRKAGYVRLKSVDIGYNFQSDWLKQRHINTLRIYLSGFNLFTVSQIKELDPEAETGAGNYYPQQRSYNLGLSLSF